MNRKEELIQFGARVRMYRTIKGLTLQDVADKCGYTSRSMISKIEKGLVDLPQTKIQQIADVLDVDILDLLGRRDSERARRLERIWVYHEMFDRLQALAPEDREKAAAMIDGILKAFEK